MTLTATGVVGTGAGSALATTHWSTTDRAGVAAGYLARHLRGPNDDHYTIDFSGTTYVDYGTTADAVLSMDAAGWARPAAARAAEFLERHVDDYAAASPTYYPGATAKLLLVALAEHRDLHDFGGVDLVQKLTDSEGAGGAPAGEYQQNPGFSGDSYVVSQALPVLALSLVATAADQPSTDAVDVLAGQQCPNGAFPSTMRDDPSTPCADNDVDSTGYAVQALLAAGRKATAAAGLAWLRSVRNHDGGYGAPVSNANSTALAVQALLAGHDSAGSGVAWLRQHQVGCGGKKGHRGAVKFQDKYDGSALRATSQAAAALAGRSLASIDRIGAHRSTPELAC
jgi:hypothetical protein